MWMARWGIFIDGDNPVDAAENARKRHSDGTSNHWTVTNLDNRETFVVDLNTKKVVPPG
ncbi:MAG: hypothetical protein ACKODT_07100 [Fluviibacter sp.]